MGQNVAGNQKISAGGDGTHARSLPLWYNGKKEDAMKKETAVRRKKVFPEAEGRQALEEILARSRRVVFFGGAGVSTASGIPDFRSAEGLYRQTGPDPEMILSKSYFYLDPAGFFDYYRRHLLYPRARPNAAHRRLWQLEQEDKLRGIVTQNIDGLHRLAGNRRVYEIHGTVHDNRCMDCGAFFPMETVLNSRGIPRCRCGGVIKPSVVLYGEGLDPYVCIGAKREISQADTLIVAGTSLSVEPAASFLEGFEGKNLVVINREKTPADRRATLVIRGGVEKVLTDETEQEETTMDPKREQQEQEWADRIDEDSEETETEKTYRDGSLANECWAQDRENV